MTKLTYWNQIENFSGEQAGIVFLVGPKVLKGQNFRRVLEIVCEGQRTRLTPIQFLIVHRLASLRRSITPRELFLDIWGCEPDEFDSKWKDLLHVHMHGVRLALGGRLEKVMAGRRLYGWKIRL